MGSAHTPSTPTDQTLATAPPTSARPAVPRIERDLAAWRSFLRAEDRRCGELGFAAAMVTVGLHRAADLEAACRLLDGELRPTDHVAVLSADELSVLLSPVESIHDARRIVQRLDAVFHAAALDAHIGWAMRHDDHGVFHAAARADAAMLTAKGHGNLAFDLSKR